MMRDAVGSSEEAAPVYFILDDVYILSDESLNDHYNARGLAVAGKHQGDTYIEERSFQRQGAHAARQEALRVTPADLRLSLEELRAYAEKCELQIDGASAEKLENMSEGWVSMIYLHFRRYAQSGEWRFDTDDIFRLMEQVMLDSLPERHQKFLIENSAASCLRARRRRTYGRRTMRRSCLTM